MKVFLNLNNINNYEKYKNNNRLNSCKPTFTGYSKDVFSRVSRNNDLFLNKESIFTEEIMSIPKKIYSGFIESKVYHSAASKNEALNQENVWMLFSPKCFSNFLKMNPDLANILHNSELGKRYKKYGIDIEFDNICNQVKNGEFNNFIKPFFDFIDALNKKYNINVFEQPKLYRFIGKSELIKLLKGEQIQNLRYFQPGIDVTTNPELNFGHSQYRVTFKAEETFDPRGKLYSADSIISNHSLEDYYFYLRKPYSIQDLEKIEMGTPHGLLEFNLKHKFTDEEINLINPLMYYYE